MAVLNKQEPSEYFGYIYLVTVTTILGCVKYYIGQRLGKYDPTYDGSVKTNLTEYKTDIHNAAVQGMQPTIDVMEYVLTSSLDDLNAAETKRLKVVDAKNNPLYYNESNGGSRVVNSDTEVETIAQKIINEKYEIDNDWTLEKLHQLERKQPRTEEFIPGRVSEIAARIDDTNGEHFDKNAPIPAWEDYFGEEKHTRFDSNHLLEACKKSNTFKDIFDKKKHKLQLIPKKVWSKLSASQMDGVELSCNPDEEITRERNDDVAYVNYLINRKFDDKIEINSQINKDHLRKTYRLSKTRVNNIIKKAERKITDVNAAKRNKIVNSWKQNKFLKKKFEDKKKALEKDKNVKVLMITGGHSNIRLFTITLIEQLRDNPSKVLNYKIFVNHTSQVDADDYVDLIVKVEKTMKWLRSKCDNNITHEYFPLPLERDQPSVERTEEQIINDIVI
jgi:hypothetical protein